VQASNYRDRLFQLIPQLYHTYDQRDGTLRAFLEALGATLDDMERNVAELYGDSFIETCHEWVVPYLGTLIGARLLETDGNRNRQEVMKTIHWRKRKGTLQALEEMAREITGWGVQAAEFFEQLGWSQNLNHLKLEHLQAPDLRRRRDLFNLGTAANRILHTVDLRSPCGRQGWFQIKTLGFFLAPVSLAHYRKVPMRRIFGQPYRFTVEPKRFPLNLFDGESRLPLAQAVMPGEGFVGFGQGTTVDVFSQGILAATPEMPNWTGAQAVAPCHVGLLDLQDGDGVSPVDYRVASGEPLKFTVTPMVLYESGGKGKLKALGHLDLADPDLPFVRSADGSGHAQGRLVIRVTPQPGYNKKFPGMVLQLSSRVRRYQVFPGTGDRQRGVYEDRAYLYLPPFCPAPGVSVDFAIDRYGSAYRYSHDGTRKQPDDEELYDSTRLARATEGVIFPSRKLTAATRPASPIYSLGRRRALQVVDRGQFLSASAPAAGWVVKAWNRDNQPGGGVLRLLTAIRLTSVAHQAVRTALEDHACEQPGHLVVSLHCEGTGKIPELELIVTDERGEALLVYLPQVDDLDMDGAFFFVAEDGATYRVNAKALPDGLVVERGPEAGPGGAFVGELLARYAAGQVLPIVGKTPICQRRAVRCDLSRPIHVRPGLVAIDPAIGRVAFAPGERPRMPLTASYYHGLAAPVGAGAWFRERDAVEETRMLRVSKRAAPDGSRHLRPPAADVLSKVKVFSTIQEAVAEAVARGGSGDGSTPWVVQIEDSEIYSETFTVTGHVPRGLIIRAAQFQRPVWRGRMIWNGPATELTPVFGLEGLVLGHTPRIRTGRFREVWLKDCTLLRRFLILSAVRGEADRYVTVTVDNCLVRGRLSIYTYVQLRLSGSALHPERAFALMARRGGVAIERSTMLGRVRVRELQASESIFLDRVEALNPQQGCIRYSRITDQGNTLPYTYQCTTAPVSFCSVLPWRSSYLKLKRTCDQPAAGWAENGGEIGVYHQAQYILKEKNLILKCDEYLPVGLTPVLIDMECE
jgi:hypothetical protein